MENTKCKKCKAELLPIFKYCPMCGNIITEPPRTKKRKRGTGSVYKIKNNTINSFVVKLNGVILGRFATQTEAEVYLSTHMKNNPAMLVLTVESVYNRYKENKAFAKLEQSSKKNIETNWKKFEDVKNKKMQDMKTTDWQEVIKKANENGCGYDGCSKVKSLISSLCKNAMLDDIINRDYSEGIDLPDKIQSVERRNFSQDEILKLFYNDEDRISRIVLCMIYMGVRIGELFNLKKENVNLEKSFVIGGEKTKAGKDRTIIIKEEILPYVKMFMAEDGEYLISNSIGTHMSENNFRERSFYPLLDNLGFDYKDKNGQNTLTPHRTRHTYMSESVSAGVKPEALRLIMGHASYTTSVTKYANDMQLEMLQEEAKKSF